MEYLKHARVDDPGISILLTKRALRHTRRDLPVEFYTNSSAGETVRLIIAAFAWWLTAFFDTAQHFQNRGILPV